MKKVFVSRHALLNGFLTLFVLTVLMPACQKIRDVLPHHDKDPKVVSGNFNQVNLVASGASYMAKRVDPLLVNGWGISWSGGGTAWIASQGKGVSVVYDREGVQGLPAVSIPSSGGQPVEILPALYLIQSQRILYCLTEQQAGFFL